MSCQFINKLKIKLISMHKYNSFSVLFKINLGTGFSILAEWNIPNQFVTLEGTTKKIEK